MDEIIIFGASNLGKSAYYALKSKYNIIFFADNNSDLWGNEFEGKEIVSPKCLNKLTNRQIVIASMYYKEIAKQLFSIGFDYTYIYQPTIESNFKKKINKYNINIEKHGNKLFNYVIFPNYISDKSIVYSFGVGKDISFETSLINKYELTVYAFDPTERSVDWVNSIKKPNNFNFYNIGISDKDGVEKFYLPENDSYVSYSSIVKSSDRFIHAEVKQFDSIANMLGHKSIDIVKLDIEGSEYKVIRDIIQSNIKVNQLIVEFHHRFKNIGYAETAKTINLLKHNGYRLFYVSETGQEFSFIRE